MAMHKALRPRDDIDCVSIKERGRGQITINDCVVASIQGLENNIKIAKKNKLQLVIILAV